MDKIKNLRRENDIGYNKVTPQVPSPEQLEPEPKKAEIANCYNVNIRKGKSPNSPRVRTVKVGTECNVLKVMNDWAQVEFPDQPGIVGYIPYKYLKEK